MQTNRRKARTAVSIAVVMLSVAAAACRRGPTRAEALDAVRAAVPGSDTATVFARVWRDGPPWFSCAEVVAKYSRSVDSAVVRDQVGNWRPLVASGWLALTDSARGVLRDPGWCYASLTAAGSEAARNWSDRPDGDFPTGTARRGWIVPVGRRQLVVTEAPRANGNDSASVRYVATVAPNANGAAMEADRDSIPYMAHLRREGGRWRVTNLRPIRAERDSAPDGKPPREPIGRRVAIAGVNGPG